MVDANMMELDELVGWMRAKGVSRLVHKGTEIELGQEPIIGGADAPRMDPQLRARIERAVLLYGGLPAELAAELSKFRGGS